MRSRIRSIESVARRGQAMVEVAMVFPLLLIVAIGLVQFALYAHAENVVTGAVQDGARIAAEDGRSLPDGVATAQALLRAGLGGEASAITLQGREDQNVVVLQAQGRLRTIIPWVADASLPLSAQATMSKERFRAGGGP